MTESNQQAATSNSSNIRYELDRLEEFIADLRVRYEQYFAGILPRAPETDHNALKMMIRVLRKAPFKSSAMMYRLRMLETRYNTYNTYWMRVLREREEGTYCKDLFKASMRDKASMEEAHAETATGVAERHMMSLFDAYKGALEKQTGKSHSLDFQSFQKSLVKRAKEFKEQHGVEKLSFKIVVKDGKVTVKAKAKS